MPWPDRRSIPVLALILVLLSPVAAEPLLEGAVQSGRYLFYRDSGDSKSFYYAPDEPRLSLGRDGRPEFLFVKYTRAGTESAPETRGGLVHFLVGWGYDEDGLRAAERALQRVEPGARLTGPLPFKAGTFAVVSASAGADGIFTRRIVGEGKAPVLPGHKAAVSIALTPEGATVLWETFQRETSEVSVVFLLTFAGLTPAYEAKLRVNWDEVYTHHDVKVGVEAQYGVLKGKLGVRAIFDDLRRKGAIELEVTGQSESMERVLDVAYEHILRQMFDPVMLPPDAASNPRPGARLAPRRRPPAGILLASYPPSFQDHGAGDDLDDAITEPYSPPPFDRESNAAAQASYQRAVESYSAEDYVTARRRFSDIYHRFHPPLTDLPVGGAGPYNPFSMLSSLLHNIARCHQHEGNFSRALFFAVLAEAWRDTEGESEAPIRSSIRDFMRENQEEVQRRNLTLPAGVTRLVEAQERSRRDYIRALREAREAYFSGNLGGAERYANAAIAALDLSEPWLWLARAADRQRPCGKALQAYRTYGERLAAEGGERDAAVERRIEELASECGEQRDPTEASTGEDVPGGETLPFDANDAAPETPGSFPTDPEQPASQDEQEGGGEDRGRQGGGKRGDDSAKETPKALSIEIGYVFRRIKQTGRYEIDLRQRLREDRELAMAGNIGGFIRNQTDRKRFLLEVNLDDPFFEDRTVEVLLDGQDYDDFKNYVNAVEVQLRRDHAEDVPTEASVVFKKEQFAADGNRLTWTYPRLGDPPEAWLDYSYRVTWNFYGGARSAGVWRSTDDSVLTLGPPVRYRTLRVTLDGDDLLDNRVRAVVVQFRHGLLGKTTTQEILVDYRRGDPLSATYRYMAPPEDDRYEARAIWVTEDGREVAQDWTTREGAYLFLKFPG